MKENVKCYIYTRVSTAMQVDGCSLEFQKDKLRRYADFNDLQVAGEYSDAGFSGKNIKGRADFQRMQDYGANLICVEDGIGSSKEAGKLMIAEDEAEVIRVIFERYIRTNDGIHGVAEYLNKHGYTKKIRRNGSLQMFSRSFADRVLDNPVYMGKIAYGRRRTEKKIGTRNEMHIVEKDEVPTYDGQLEAIMSEEDWKMAAGFEV